jgi:hypothetical protein
MATDYQRQRVYDAEQAVSLALGKGDDMSLDDCQVYADAVCEAEGITSVTVTRRQGERKSHYQVANQTIKLATWGCCEQVLLHELSHHVEALHGRVSGHGPSFAASYLRLLDENMGSRRADAMRFSFDHFGVQYERESHRVAPENVAAFETSRGLTFDQIKVGATYALSDLVRPAQFRGRKVLVIKKNRTKVVCRIHALTADGVGGGFYRSHTLPPEILREIS